MIVTLRRAKQIKMSVLLRDCLHKGGLIKKTPQKPMWNSDAVDHLFYTEVRDHESVLADVRAVVEDLGLEMRKDGPLLREMLIAFIDHPYGTFRIYQKQ